MTQRDLNRAVARATGETVETIERLGFGLWTNWRRTTVRRRSTAAWPMTRGSAGIVSTAAAPVRRHSRPPNWVGGACWRLVRDCFEVSARCADLGMLCRPRQRERNSMLIRGDRLTACQRAQVLAAYSYRWTHEIASESRSGPRSRGDGRRFHRRPTPNGCASMPFTSSRTDHA